MQRGNLSSGLFKSELTLGQELHAAVPLQFSSLAWACQCLCVLLYQVNLLLFSACPIGVIEHLSIATRQVLVRINEALTVRANLCVAKHGTGDMLLIQALPVKTKASQYL